MTKLNHLKLINVCFFKWTYNFFFIMLAVLVVSEFSTTGVKKVKVCAILSEIVHIKEPLLLIERVAHVMGAASFLLTI